MPEGELTDSAMAVDVKRLLKLAHDRSDAGRAGLVNAVEQLVHRGLGDAERRLAGEILVHLCQQVEMEIRRALAEQLAGSDQAPRELMRFLAQDEIPVATPVIQLSPVLDSDDLVAIVKQASRDHARIVAGRQALPSPVTVALAQTGDVGIVETLLKNDSVTIDPAAMLEIAGMAESRSVLRAPLLHRPEMSDDLATRLYVWVGRELRNVIAERFEINRLALDQAIDATLQRFIAATEYTQMVSPELTEWAEGLASCGRINPQMMLRVLRQGRTVVFVALFAAYFRLSTRIARDLLSERGATRMAIACRAGGVGKEEFASLFLLSRELTKDRAVIDPRDLSSVLNLYDRIDRSAATGALEKLQAASKRDDNLPV